MTEAEYAALTERVKAHAYSQFNSAIKSGQLKRGKFCQLCGARGKMDGHHFDYSLPLQVTWLCETCHAGFHARHTAKRRAYRPTPRPIWLPDPGTADTLKAIRTRKDWTQAEMALAVGCGLRTYLRYEAGTRVPPATIWLKACALDATTEAHM